MKSQPIMITIQLNDKAVTVKLTEYLSRIIASGMFDVNNLETIYYAAGYVSSELVHERKGDN